MNTNLNNTINTAVAYVVAAILSIITSWVIIEFGIWVALLFINFGLLPLIIFGAAYFAAIFGGVAVFGWYMLAHDGLVMLKDSKVSLPNWAPLFSVFDFQRKPTLAIVK